MKKLLYLTTSLGLLSTTTASNQFTWSDDKAELMYQITQVERSIAQSREDFGEEMANVERWIKWVKESTDPDQALMWLDPALRSVTYNGIVITRVRNMPAVIAEREVVEKKEKTFRIFRYDEFDREYEAFYRNLNSRPDVRNVVRFKKESELSAVELSIPIIGWIGGVIHKYDGQINYEVVSRERYVVQPARQEVRSLHSLKSALEQMQATLVAQQRRYREKKAAEEDDRRRQQEKDRKAAEIAATKGDGAKLNQLGYDYLNGNNGKNEDQKHAVHLFKLSHEAGNSIGSNIYGRAYLWGWGGTMIQMRRHPNLRKITMMYLYLRQPRNPLRVMVVLPQSKLH